MSQQMRSSDSPAAGRVADGSAEFPGPSRKHAWLLGLLLVAALLLAYQPVWDAGFIWDDDTHITNNETLRSLSRLWEIWLKPGATCQYYPLSFSWFWISYHLWGLNPMGYHLQNVMLHGLAAVLLWQVLERLKVRGAWLAGAIFALHPVCVMSVAWVTELKNTLSGALALGAGWAYARFAGLGVYDMTEHRIDDGKGSRPGWRYYVLALALFQLAIFAKTAVSFLPVTLLLVVWWQREQMGWRDVWPLIPMLGIVMVMGGVTIYVERHSGGASGQKFNVPPLDRFLISGRSFWFYLGKLFFPHRLTFIYERWKMDAGAWRQYVCPAATVGLLAGLWGMRRRLGKGPFVAMMHFYVSTSLLILIVVLYMTSYSFVSDHWQYFGCMSLIALSAAGITRALGCFRKRSPLLEPAFCGALLLTLGVLTWRQCRMYADAETLWRTTIARNPNAWMAYDNLGIVLSKTGRGKEAVALLQKVLASQPNDPWAGDDLGLILLQQGQEREATAQFQKVLASRPDDAVAHDNLGLILLQQGQAREAMVQFQKAMESDPRYPMAPYNLGNLLLTSGQVDEAIGYFQKALAVQPSFGMARDNLGIALLQKGREREAVMQFQKALSSDPDDATAHYNLGNIFFQNGQVDEAIAHFQKAQETQPGFAEAHNNLGVALLQKGRVDEAIEQFLKALEIRPGFADAANDLADVAWHLAASPDISLRNGPKALAVARQLDRLSGGNNPAILDLLAAAYAESGQFSEAVDAAQRALALSPANATLTDTLRQHIKLFQAGSPLRNAPKTEVAPGSNRP